MDQYGPTSSTSPPFAGIGENIKKARLRRAYSSATVGAGWSAEILR